MLFNKNIPVGVMIEIPAAALASDVLAKEVDFFSLGTNDLIQYVLAIDRMNEKIAHLYEPTHPAIIRLIDLTIRNGHGHNIWVGSCGEMSSDPAIAILLVGLGIDEISASPVMLPKIKKAIRSIRYSDAKEIAQKALAFHTGKETYAFLKEKPKTFVRSLPTNNGSLSEDLANQVVKARAIAGGISLPSSFIKRPEKVLYCGMGVLPSAEIFLGPLPRVVRVSIGR